MRKGPKTNFLEAAIAVLSTARRPLTVAEITQQAIDRGILTTSGKTPKATMNAALYTREAQLREARIVKVYEPGRIRAKRGSVRWKLERPS